MKTINKTGLRGKIATQAIASVTDYRDALVDDQEIAAASGNTPESGDVSIDYNFTNNGNSWNRAQFYWHTTSAGNLVIS